MKMKRILVLSRSEPSFQLCSKGKMVWKDGDSPLRHDICAEIRDWRDEVHRFTTIGYSSQLLFPFCKSSTVQPFQTISSILGAELTFALPLHFTLIPSPSPHLITLFRKNKWREYRGRRIIIIPRESKIIFDNLEISIE